MEADFSGFATKAGLKCTDGRTIMKDAFGHQAGTKVPLVWQHGHKDIENVLGHVLLENKEGDVYAYAYFNNTPKAQAAKAMVEHGDITRLSIWANELAEKAKQVMHGTIREVSLVLAGANPGAVIDNVRIAHGDGFEDEVLEEEAIIFQDQPIEHAQPAADGDVEHAAGDTSTKTVQEVYDSFSEEQLGLLHAFVSKALEVAPAAAGGSTAAHSADAPSSEAGDNEGNNDEGDLNDEGNDMSHNLFEGKDGKGGAAAAGGQLSHAQVMDLVSDFNKTGSLKEAIAAHADDYGITNIEMLFPDAQLIDSTPQWITRKMDWVEGVINGARKLPFSKIKSRTADLTHDEARAKGYIKGNLKKEQFFAIAQRETHPTTVYKKQKLDRDDIVDITDFDVVAWIWVEMRFMLREEIARAILVGDGREVDDDDKIDETKIRPIAQDDEFYTDVLTVDSNVSQQDLIEAVLRGRPNYKGTGATAYMTEAVGIDMLLSKDRYGRRYYQTPGELAAALGVSNVVYVPVLEGAERDGGEIEMIIVNMADYAIGSTRGGEISTFDDFDIDYNQYKYLIEGRMSGALMRPKTAQVVVRGTGTEATPAVPTFNTGTGVLTVPATTGVVYKNQDTDATLTAGAQTAIASGETISVVAVPAAGYYFPHNFDADWEFTRS